MVSSKKIIILTAVLVSISFIGLTAMVQTVQTVQTIPEEDSVYIERVGISDELLQADAIMGDVFYGNSTDPIASVFDGVPINMLGIMSIDGIDTLYIGICEDCEYAFNDVMTGLKERFGDIPYHVELVGPVKQLGSNQTAQTDTLSPADSNQTAQTDTSSPEAPSQTPQTYTSSPTTPSQTPPPNALVTVDAVSQNGTQTIPESISSANNEFAVDFYKQILDAEEGNNIFYSPASLYVAFSLLYEGAKENTAQQMEDIFGFESDILTRHNATAHALSSLNRDDDYATLNMANALWIANWFAPYESYLDITRSTYLADAQTVNFSDEDDSINRINDWAAEKTHGKITEVIRKSDVNGDTAMVINNAIYFKGTWLTQFAEEDTKKSEFYTDDTQSVNTDFMNVVSMFNYVYSDGAKVLKMPYEGDRLSMLVILPDDPDMRQFEESLSVQQIQKWTDNLWNQEVIVSIPKFETRTNYKLGNHLTAMGMPDVFSSGDADLSGIGSTNGGNLHVTEAVQDAYVKVNEEGTEAAAVTTIISTIESVSPTPPPPPKFIADHPFLFVIQDDESGMILFMGRISNPA